MNLVDPISLGSPQGLLVLHLCHQQLQDSLLVAMEMIKMHRRTQTKQRQVRTEQDSVTFLLTRENVILKKEPAKNVNFCMNKHLCATLA